MSDCLFCKIIAGEIPSKKVYEDEHVYAFHDISPAAPTHILIIPKKHISTVNDLTDDDLEIPGRLFLTAKRIAKEQGFAEDGFRLVMNTGNDGGQTVYHIHLHLLAGRQLAWPPG